MVRSPWARTAAGTAMEIRSSSAFMTEASGRRAPSICTGERKTHGGGCPPCVFWYQYCDFALEVDIESQRPVPSVPGELTGVIQPVAARARSNAPTQRHDEVHRGPV